MVVRVVAQVPYQAESILMRLRERLEPTAYFFILLAVTLPLVSIALSQIFLGTAILVFLIHWISSARKPIIFPPFKLPLLLFMGSTVVALIFSPEPRIGLAPINKFWLFAIIPLTANLFDRKRSEQAFTLLFALGVLGSLLVICQFLIVRNINTEARLTGFMGHWMTLSGELMLVFISSTGYLLFGRSDRKSLWTMGLLLISIALCLTLTRSVWMAAFAGMLLLLLMRHFHWSVLAVVGVSCGFVWMLAPQVIQRRMQSIWDTHDPSNYARVAIWEAGLRMVEQHPWLGVGPQRVSRVFYEYHPRPEDRNRSGFYPVHMHNNLLQFAAERGIFCSLCWLWFMSKLALDHWREFRRQSRLGIDRAIPAIGFAAVVTLFLAGLFEFNFGDSEVLMIFLFLSSLPYAARLSLRTTIPAFAARAVQ